MTIDAWLSAAVTDAERRGLPELKPILEALGRATTALRKADFNDDAAAEPSRSPGAIHPAESSRSGSSARSPDQSSGTSPVYERPAPDGQR